MKLQAILALLCALAAAAAYYFTPHLMLADLQPVKLETMVPEQFGEWRMVPENGGIISSPEQDKFIKSIYSQVLTRTYMNDAGHHIMLSIAYTRDQSDNSGTQSHKPEICYPAQGFNIHSKTIRSLEYGHESLPVVQMVAIDGARIEPLTYWLMIGQDRAITQSDVKRLQIAYGLRDQIPDGLIFRVSVIGEDIQQGFALQQQFIEHLFSALSPAARRRLAGIDG